MEAISNGEQPTSPERNCYVNLIPSELFAKFRKEIEWLRVALNLEFYNAPINEFRAKLVLKPSARDRKWKFIYEPLRYNVLLRSKKIPITEFLNLQVGIGHSFLSEALVCRWKLTTSLGGDDVTMVRDKKTFGLCPGVDIRFGFRALCEFPEITGAVGTAEPLFNMSPARLFVSLDRIETIFTHKNEDGNQALVAGSSDLEDTRK